MSVKYTVGFLIGTVTMYIVMGHFEKEPLRWGILIFSILLFGFMMDKDL